MTKLELATKWFYEEDVPCYTCNNSLFIKVGDFDYEISQTEVDYRAELIEGFLEEGEEDE